MKDKHESGNAPHGDSHLRGGQKTGKQKKGRCHGREHGRRTVWKRGTRYGETDGRSGYGQSQALEAFLKCDPFGIPSTSRWTDAAIIV